MADEPKADAKEEGGDAVTKKDEGAAPAAGGPNQKLVFIVLILNSVVLAVLAAVVWKSYVANSHQVSLNDVAAPADGSSAAEGGEHGGGEHGGGEHGKEGGGEHGKEGGHGGKEKEGEKKGADENFIYESFTVNLADSRSSHFAAIDVAIEVEDPNATEQVTRLRPKIRDFINVVLSSKTYEQIESVDGREFLREEIRNKINGYLTRGQIKNVFFTKFVIQ